MKALPDKIGGEGKESDGVYGGWRRGLETRTGVTQRRKSVNEGEEGRDWKQQTKAGENGENRRKKGIKDSVKGEREERRRKENEVG